MDDFESLKARILLKQEMFEYSRDSYDEWDTAWVAALQWVLDVIDEKENL